MSVSQASSLFLVLLLLGFVSGCGSTKSFVGDKSDASVAPASALDVASQIPPGLLAGSKSKGRLEAVGDYYVDSRQKEQLNKAAAVARKDDIVYTQPNASQFTMSADLKEIFSIDYEGPWMTDFRKAGRRTQREKKPLLIWFTDSQGSPTSNNLAKEVFDKDEFGKWAAENVVRLRFDRNIENGLGSEEDKKKKYIEKMRQRYKVRATPYVILQLPDGTVSQRYRGYRKGNSEFYFGAMRRDVETAKAKIDAWWKGMERKGYRIWKNREDSEVLARLIKYDDPKVTLVEPDGKRSIFDQKKLSLADRMWILEQKAKRNAR